jgi:hypothetical protein
VKFEKLLEQVPALKKAMGKDDRCAWIQFLI